MKNKKYFKINFIDLKTLCWPNRANIKPEQVYEIGVLTANHQKVETIESFNMLEKEELKDQDSQETQE